MFKIIISIIISLYSFNITALNENQIANDISNIIASYSKSSIDFTQTNPDGSLAEGILLIEKPYNFRCNYFEPYPLLIVGSKKYTSIYDYNLEEISRISAKDNPLNFLLSGNIDFKKLYKIEKLESDSQYNIITISAKDFDAISKVKIRKNDRQIDEIRFYDEDNNVTIIKFKNKKIVKKFNPELFIIKNPKIFGTVQRLDLARINKYITY